MAPNELVITAEVIPGFLVRIGDKAQVFVPLSASGEAQPALDITPFELYLSNVAVLPFGTELDSGKPEPAAE